MDYQEHLEASDDMIDISERVFEVQVAEDVFKKLQQQAASLIGRCRKLSIKY
jgi:hypothetical protein